MKQLTTKGIILGRTDYGEADRILTLLTPDYGKLRLMARGVRRIKSKLAGGIELFSVSDITFIKGRGDIGTLISARLRKHYGRIVQDVERTMLAYDLMKQLHTYTEDEAGPEYFELLTRVFGGLDDPAVAPQLTDFWFTVQLTRLGGHMPDLLHDSTGAKLDAGMQYAFDPDSMHFTPQPGKGRFNASHIKFLRLAFGDQPPQLLAHVQGAGALVTDMAHIFDAMKRAIF